MIVAGPASQELGRKLASITGRQLCELEHKLFPDGESYLRFKTTLENEELVIIQGTHPPQDRHLIQLMLLVDAARMEGASKIRLVIPYLAYARQDRKFLEGEAVSIDTILKTLKNLGADEIYTVNIHSLPVVERSPVPIRNIDASGLLASYILQVGVDNPLVVSPGKKGELMAAEVANVLETDFAPVTSRRDPVTGEVEVEIDANPKGRDVVFVDDIISTGGTAVKTVKKLRDLGARRIIVACIHGLFIGEADKRIMEAGASLILATDTVPNDYATATVAGLLIPHVGL